MSHSCKYLHISEDPERHWIIFKTTRYPLKSRQPHRSTPHQHNDHHVANGHAAPKDSTDVLVRFLIMQSRPLCFLEQFEVRKSVFGKLAQDADLRRGQNHISP